ncbi:hypothetical protein [Candidatus Palauibacter sp.]|uniref:hypothetical protein n=1 Tax=Candidatus Palauibacter sp. TaxID=3101350 RepID=UPI003B02360F
MKIGVGVDGGLIEQVRDLLQVSSLDETVDYALREVLRRDARSREIEALVGMDGLDLSDEYVMARAWRS